MKENKIKKIKSFRSFSNAIKKERKERPFYYFFNKIYWSISRYIRKIFYKIIIFWQRGCQGWAESDTWDFSSYLTDIIIKGLRHFKRNCNGYPINITEGKWIDILNKIINTFEYTEKIRNDELYLIRNKKKRNEWEKELEKINKSEKINLRCMTDKEIKEYDEGWFLFKTYFASLWD